MSSLNILERLGQRLEIPSLNALVIRLLYYVILDKHARTQLAN